MSFQIDDDGLLALVDPAAYPGFVAEDWQADALLAHFLTHMRQGSLLVWGTDPNGGSWTVDGRTGPSTQPAFRELTFPLRVTAGALYLTSYGDLTMAAQFRDERLPSAQNAALRLALPNGSYALTVRQLYDLTSYDDYPPQGPHFELIARPVPAGAVGEPEPVTAIFWR